MKFSKRILRNKWIQWLLCNLIAGYIRLVYLTSRWTIKGHEILATYDNKDYGNAIFAFWHGRLLMVPKFCPKGRKMHVVISVHNDGEIIARAVESLNIGLIRGSSRKGGVAALIEARKILRQGDNVAITPDGPKGPRMRVNSNIVALAKMTGLPIIPVTYSVSHAITFRSWDRFLLALPFGKAIFIYGDPIIVDPDSDTAAIQALNQTLEDELNRITAEADTFAGVEPVSPA